MVIGKRRDGSKVGINDVVKHNVVSSLSSTKRELETAGAT